MVSKGNQAAGGTYPQPKGAQGRPLSRPTPPYYSAIQPGHTDDAGWALIKGRLLYMDRYGSFMDMSGGMVLSHATRYTYNDASTLPPSDPLPKPYTEQAVLAVLYVPTLLGTNWSRLKYEFDRAPMQRGPVTFTSACNEMRGEHDARTHYWPIHNDNRQTDTHIRLLPLHWVGEYTKRMDYHMEAVVTARLDFRDKLMTLSNGKPTQSPKRRARRQAVDDQAPVLHATAFARTPQSLTTHNTGAPCHSPRGVSLIRTKHSCSHCPRYQPSFHVGGE